ncbi:histidine kinase [Spirillospora sp. CA-253888]
MPPEAPGSLAFWRATLRRWNIVWWLLLGLMFLAIAAPRDRGPHEYGALAALAAIAAGHLALGRLLRPHAYLVVLGAGMGIVSYLWNGSGALFMVSLPHFWIHARSRRAAIALSGAGALASAVGCLLRQGPTTEGFNSAVSVAVFFAASVLMGLWVRTVVEQSQERARLIDELERTQAELALAHQRQGAAEERQRMSRDIHDTIAQGLASIIVLAEAAREGLPADPGASARQLRSIEKTARENLTEARDLVAAGQPAAAGPFTRTLRRTLDRFAEDTGLAVHADLADADADQPTRIALLRCLQESLANVRKHAGASSVTVVLAATAQGVELEVTDDGSGFTPGPGFGLAGMRDRLAELGGRLTVTGSPEDGTRVLAQIPLNSPLNSEVAT